MLTITFSYQVELKYHITDILITQPFLGGGIGGSVRKVENMIARLGGLEFFKISTKPPSWCQILTLAFNSCYYFSILKNKFLEGI